MICDLAAQLGCKCGVLLVVGSRLPQLVVALIAAAALLTLLQFDHLSPFLIVLFVIGTIQLVVANVVEPAVMGRSLNLSPLVVIFSLVVWGTIWGVVGMFLCVPMTVMLLIVLAHFKTTHPVAVLLSADGRTRLDVVSSMQGTELDLSAWPDLKRWLDACLARPANARARALRK